MTDKKVKRSSTIMQKIKSGLKNLTSSGASNKPKPAKKAEVKKDAAPAAATAATAHAATKRK